MIYYKAIDIGFDIWWDDKITIQHEPDGIITGTIHYKAKEIYFQTTNPLIHNIRYAQGKDAVIRALNLSDLKIYHPQGKCWIHWDKIIQFKPDRPTPYIYDISSGKEFLQKCEPTRITKEECDMHLLYY